MAVKKTGTTGTSVADNGGGSFVLGDAELTLLVSARGRKATDSVYLDDIKTAIANGDAMNGVGVRITEARKGPWIAAQLRKGFKQLEVDPKDYSVFDRTEHGFIAYKVKPAAEETVSE